MSYCHDDDVARRGVSWLVARLADEGVVCVYDQQVSGSPAEGWHRWTESSLRSCDFAVAVITPTYAERFAGRRSLDRGAGADLEGRLLTNLLAGGEWPHHRVVPVVFERADRARIPLLLKDGSAYTLPDQYKELLRHLFRQPGRPPVAGSALAEGAPAPASRIAMGPDTGPAPSPASAPHARRARVALAAVTLLLVAGASATWWASRPQPVRGRLLAALLGAAETAVPSPCLAAAAAPDADPATARRACARELMLGARTRSFLAVRRAAHGLALATERAGGPRAAARSRALRSLANGSRVLGVAGSATTPIGPHGTVRALVPAVVPELEALEAAIARRLDLDAPTRPKSPVPIAWIPWPGDASALLPDGPGDQRDVIAALLAVAGCDIALWPAGGRWHAVLRAGRLGRWSGQDHLAGSADEPAPLMAAALRLVRAFEAYDGGRLAEVATWLGRPTGGPLPSPWRAWSGYLRYRVELLEPTLAFGAPLFDGLDATPRNPPAGAREPALPRVPGPPSLRAVSARWLVTALRVLPLGSRVRREARDALMQLRPELAPPGLRELASAALTEDSLAARDADPCLVRPEGEREAEVSRVLRMMEDSGDVAGLAWALARLGRDDGHLGRALKLALLPEARPERISILRQILHSAYAPSSQVSRATLTLATAALVRSLETAHAADRFPGHRARDAERLALLADLPGPFPRAAIERLLDVVLADEQGARASGSRAWAVLRFVLLPRLATILTGGGPSRLGPPLALLDASLARHAAQLQDHPTGRLELAIVLAGRLSTRIFELLFPTWGASSVAVSGGTLDGLLPVSLDDVDRALASVDVVELARSVPDDEWPLRRQPTSAARDVDDVGPWPGGASGRWDPRPYGPALRLLVDSAQLLASLNARQPPGSLLMRYEALQIRARQTLTLYLERAGASTAARVAPMLSDMLFDWVGDALRAERPADALVAGLAVLREEKWPEVWRHLARDGAPTWVSDVVTVQLDLALSIVALLRSDEPEAARPDLERVAAAARRLERELPREGGLATAGHVLLVTLGRAPDAVELVRALRNKPGPDATARLLLPYLEPLQALARGLVDEHMDRGELELGLVDSDNAAYLVFDLLAFVGEQPLDDEPVALLRRYAEHLARQLERGSIRGQRPSANRVLLAATLAAVAWAQGRHDVGDAWLEQAHAWSEGTVHEPFRWVFTVARAELALSRRQPETVLDYVDRFGASCPALAWSTLPLSARALLMQGRPRAAADRLDRYIDAMGSRGSATVRVALALRAVLEPIMVHMVWGYQLAGLPWVSGAAGQYQLGVSNTGDESTERQQSVQWSAGGEIPSLAGIVNASAMRVLALASQGDVLDAMDALRRCREELAKAEARQPHAAVVSELREAHPGLVTLMGLLARAWGLPGEARAMQRALIYAARANPATVGEDGRLGPAALSLPRRGFDEVVALAPPRALAALLGAAAQEAAEGTGDPTRLDADDWDLVPPAMRSPAAPWRAQAAAHRDHGQPERAREALLRGVELLPLDEAIHTELLAGEAALAGIELGVEAAGEELANAMIRLASVGWSSAAVDLAVSAALVGADRSLQERLVGIARRVATEPVSRREQLRLTLLLCETLLQGGLLEEAVLLADQERALGLAGPETAGTASSLLTMVKVRVLLAQGRNQEAFRMAVAVASDALEGPGSAWLTELARATALASLLVTSAADPDALSTAEQHALDAGASHLIAAMGPGHPAARLLRDVHQGAARSERIAAAQELLRWVVATPTAMFL